MWGTDITDFKIEPVKPTYIPGESVVLSGRIELHKMWWTSHPDGLQIEIWSDTVKTEFGGWTGSGGWFKIVVVLPLKSGIYSYRARFPGHDLAAMMDGSWSDTITLSIKTPTPISPPPPPPPTEVFPPVPPLPPGIPTYLFYASLGLIGIGTLMWLMKK